MIAANAQKKVDDDRDDRRDDRRRDDRRHDNRDREKVPDRRWRDESDDDDESDRDRRDKKEKRDPKRDRDRGDRDRDDRDRDRKKRSAEARSADDGDSPRAKREKKTADSRNGSKEKLEPVTQGATVNGEPAGPPRPRRKTRWSEIDLEKEKARIAKNKVDLGSIDVLAKKVNQEREQLKLFVIKAKQDFEEKQEKAKKDGKLNDSDPEGYFAGSLGDIVGENLELGPSLGRGVFSSVYKCKDIRNGEEVAVKFIRNNQMMRKAAEKEVEMYKWLHEEATKRDPAGAVYFIKMVQEPFDHADHYVLIFDLQKCDMRTAVAKYGQGAGLPLVTTALFGRQLCHALSILQYLKVIHLDLKPDNLLMNLNKTELRICDFGTATKVAAQVRTSYAQPRYYRAPEVMLGLNYTTQVDMWSFGCSLYEMATGQILFTGKSNNEMLRQIQERCGPIPLKMVKDGGEYGKKHFDEKTGDFLRKEKNDMTGENEKSTVPSSSFSKISWAEKMTKVANPAGLERPEFEKQASLLGDLIGDILNPSIADRLWPDQALQHDFFKQGIE